MNKRIFLSTILVIFWGIFNVSAQSVQADQQDQVKKPVTTTKKVVSTTSEKKGATPATPAVPATPAKKMPATVKQGVQSAKPATPAKPAVKPITTGKPGTTTQKPASITKDITGYWITAQKATIVEFYKNGDKYNGKAVWSRQKDKSGKPLRDVNNPDRTKRNNPIVGTNLISGLTYNPKTDTYEGGKVYQPQTGKSFNCKVKLDKNKNTMQITGGAGFISKTLTWTRTTGIPGK